MKTNNADVNNYVPHAMCLKAIAEEINVGVGLPSTSDDNLSISDKNLSMKEMAPRHVK